MAPSSGPAFSDAAQQVLDLCAQHMKTRIVPDLIDRGYDVDQARGEGHVTLSAQPNERQGEQWRTPFYLRTEIGMADENPVLSMTLDYPPMAAQHCRFARKAIESGFNNSLENTGDTSSGQLRYEIILDQNGRGKILPFLGKVLESLTQVNSARVLRSEREHQALQQQQQ